MRRQYTEMHKATLKYTGQHNKKPSTTKYPNTRRKRGNVGRNTQKRRKCAGIYTTHDESARKCSKRPTHRKPRESAFEVDQGVVLHKKFIAIILYHTNLFQNDNSVQWNCFGAYSPRSLYLNW